MWSFKAFSFNGLLEPLKHGLETIGFKLGELGNSLLDFLKKLLDKIKSLSFSLTKIPSVGTNFSWGALRWKPRWPNITFSGLSMKWTSGQNSNKKNTSLWATITTLATRIKWWIGQYSGILVKFFVTEVCTRLQNGTVAGLPAPVQKIADKPGAQS